MTAKARMKKALRDPPIGYPVAMDEYDSTQEDYMQYGDDYNKFKALIVYNVSTSDASFFADNEVKKETTYFQVHIYSIKNFNENTLIKEIRTRIMAAGFGYPNKEIDTVDDGIRHICLTTNITQGE